MSRRNAVSAGKGPPANRRLARDRHEIRKVIDGNRERAIGTAKPFDFVAGEVHMYLLTVLDVVNIIEH